jgi:NTE family protein
MEKIYGFCGSGGGAKGAWGGGVSEFLVNDLDRKYSYLSGTSTGSLLMNLISIGEMERLKEAYTSVTNKDIYTISPYRIVSSKNGVFKTKMNYLKIGYNILFRKSKTFGDSSKLREVTIPKFFTKDDYYRIREENKELFACVTNLTLGVNEFKSSKKCSYDDFLDWIYASSCAAPIMSIVEKDGYEYADGGYIEHSPIQVLIDNGCDIIDVVCLRSPSIDIEKIRNPLHLISRLMLIMEWEIFENDLNIAKLKAKDKDVIINIYRPDKELTNNSLVFDKKVMTDWWNDGYEFAKSQCHVCYNITKGKKPKLIK